MFVNKGHANTAPHYVLDALSAHPFASSRLHWWTMEGNKGLVQWRNNGWWSWWTVCWFDFVWHIVRSIFFAFLSPFSTSVLQYWVYQVTRMCFDSSQHMFMDVHLNHADAATWWEHNDIASMGTLFDPDPHLASTWMGSCTIPRCLLLWRAKQVDVKVGDFKMKKLWLLPTKAV